MGLHQKHFQTHHLNLYNPIIRIISPILAKKTDLWELPTSHSSKKWHPDENTDLATKSCASDRLDFITLLMNLQENFKS